jgi:hypothetical protein
MDSYTPLQIRCVPSRAIAEVVKSNILDLYIHIRKHAVFHVGLDDFVLAFLLNDGALHISIQEVERARLIAFDRETIAAKVEFGPAHEVILVLCFLGTVLKVAIVDRSARPTSLILTIIGCILASDFWLSKVSAASVHPAKAGIRGSLINLQSSLESRSLSRQ